MSNSDEYRDADDDEQISSESSIKVSTLSQHSDDSDDYDEKPGKRKKNLKKSSAYDKPRKKIKKNKFVEEEAEEASEDDEDSDVGRMEINDREMDKQFQTMLKKSSNKNVIQDIENRYAQTGYQEDQQDDDGLASYEDEVEAPTASEPNIWRVGCSRGKENEAVTSLMFKYATHRNQNQPLDIVSVFAIKKFPGTLFVEAHYDWQVMKAIEDIYNVMKGKIEMVEPEQCKTLFSPVEQEEITIRPGDWVRIKSHQIYEGDLGRALAIDPVKRTLYVKLIPREKREIASFNHNNEQQVAGKSGKPEKVTIPGLKGEIEEELPIETKKYRHNKWQNRTKYLMEMKRFVRGPKISIKTDKRHHYDDDDELDGDRNSLFLYDNNINTEKSECKKDGFYGLTTSINNVISKNVKPKLEELALFYPDVKDIRTILPKLNKSLKNAVETKHNFKVGDKVCLIGEKREFQGVTFQVTELLQDGKLKISSKKKDPQTNETKVFIHEVDAEQVRIVLKKYQLVTVISGQNKGLQGVIIEIKQKTAVISTDQSRVIEVFLGDLEAQNKISGYDQTINSDPYKASRQALDNKQSRENIGGVTRYDLIKYGNADVDIGCVLSVSKDDITVIDATNRLRTINQMTITAKPNTKNNVAKNTHRQEIRKGDQIQIHEGFYKGVQAGVIHVYRDNLFLQSGRFQNTQGVIVEKVNNSLLISSSQNEFQRPRPPPKTDATQTPQSQTKDPNQELLGTYITIARGKWSGYRGLVLSIQARTVTVQLTAKNMNVNVLKEEVNPSSGPSSHHQLGPGMTPHYAPNQSMRVYDENDHQKVMQGYQSPYAYGQTPSHNYD